MLSILQACNAYKYGKNYRLKYATIKGKILAVNSELTPAGNLARQVEKRWERVSEVAFWLQSAEVD
jgi:hypothetical protein